MNKNLNQDLYSRFVIELDLKNLQEGLRVCLKNSLSENLIEPIQPKQGISCSPFLPDNFLKDFCRQLPPLNYFDVRHRNDFRNFILGNFLKGDISKVLFNIQILFNVLYRNDFLSLDYLEGIVEELGSYLDDYPALGYKLKIYKAKPPQILPSISKFFNKEVDDVLGLLEANKYKDVLINFENGLKEFLQAKTVVQFKNVVNNMLSACDELSKIIFNDQGKGFKHVFDRSNNQNNWEKFGLNGKQKEIFKNLRDFMDDIKHGLFKKINRNDTEMIISLVASFIRFSANYHEKF